VKIYERVHIEVKKLEFHNTYFALIRLPTTSIFKRGDVCCRRDEVSPVDSKQYSLPSFRMYFSLFAFDTRFVSLLLSIYESRTTFSTRTEQSPLSIVIKPLSICIAILLAHLPSYVNISMAIKSDDFTQITYKLRALSALFSCKTRLTWKKTDK